MAKVTCRVCARSVGKRNSPDEVPGVGAYPVPHNDLTGEPCPGADQYAVEGQPFVREVNGQFYP